MCGKSYSFWLCPHISFSFFPMFEADLCPEHIRFFTIFSFKCYMVLALNATKTNFDCATTCSFLEAHEKLSEKLDNMGQDLTKKLKFKLKLKKGLHGRAVPALDDGLKGATGNLGLEASKR